MQQIDNTDATIRLDFSSGETELEEALSGFSLPATSSLISILEPTSTGTISVKMIFDDLVKDRESEQ